MRVLVRRYICDVCLGEFDMREKRPERCSVVIPEIHEGGVSTSDYLSFEHVCPCCRQELHAAVRGVLSSRRGAAVSSSLKRPA